MPRIRPLRTHADLQACVRLQYEIWGRDFTDAVPASILLVSQIVGSVAAGAFDDDGRLAGFVFGITGVENGRIVHWSDMLAVREDTRNAGIGRELKEYQRRAVAAIGGKVIYWTFDPLVARNAHLNLNVFGVRVTKYVRDMYGAHTGSILHSGIGTDRLVVAWPVDDAELDARRAEIARYSAERRSLEAPVIGDPESVDSGIPTIGDRARIAAPADIVVLQRSAPAAAARWRASTRDAFDRCFAAGLEVHGFQTDRASHRGFYLLGRTP